MLKKIYLIRHGETEYNRNKKIQGWLDIPLNETGHAQARVVAEKLKGVKVHAIYASDQIRAKETAGYIAALHRQDVIIAPEVREHKLGVFEGWGWEDKSPELNVLWNELMESMENPEHADWQKHQGESIREFRTRVKKFLDMVEVKHPDEVIIVVTHGGTIRRFLEVLELKELGGDENTKNTQVITITQVDGRYTLEAD